MQKFYLLLFAVLVNGLLFAQNFEKIFSFNAGESVNEYAKSAVELNKWQFINRH